jgi:CBS domain containing-hemolysin-like protein
MTNVFGIAFETLAVLALVATNGFFVAAEFALVKVRTSQLRPLEKTGGWRVKLALWAVTHLDAILSATQLGITLASLGLGWIGEPFVAEHLEPVLSGWGITNPATVESISFAAAFITITFFHIVFGELGPKWLAIQRSTAVTIWVAAPLIAFYYTLFPFIWVLNRSSSRILGWLGLGPSGSHDQTLSDEELEYVFSHARHHHPGDALVNKLMVQSLRVRGTTARMIMRPREQAAVLWLDRSTSENLRIAQTSGHSRFPVCEGSLDNVKGVLLVREWLWQLQALGGDSPFAPLVRPILRFKLTTPLSEMIEKFRSARSHLAAVFDDNGALAGIITLEDVLEEIVGDIRDEFDIERGPIFERTENSITVSGAFTLREIQAETGWPLEWQPRETVGAWVVRHLGRVPQRDDRVLVGEIRAVVLDGGPERPRRVRLERNLDSTPPV